MKIYTKDEVIRMRAARQGRRPKYRWRTTLRGWLPWRPPLYHLARKGKDCGGHVWYRQDTTTHACYHCRVTREGGVIR